MEFGPASWRCRRGTIGGSECRSWPVGGADQTATIYWSRLAPVSGVVAGNWLVAPAVAGPFTILCVGVKKKGRIERESRRGGGEGPDRTEPGPRPPAPKARGGRGEGRGRG